MTPLLEVKNVTAGYGDTKIIQDIHFDLQENEVLGIVGESGCGKSTLLKALLRLEGMYTEIFSGSICYDGQDLTAINREERRKMMGQEIAVIFQHPEASFNPSRKIGIQFLETFQSHVDSISYEEMRRQVGEIFAKIALTDVDRILDAYPFELSGGMTQRVAVVLAMVLRPKLILADEPTSALDTTVQKQVVRELMALKESTETAMIVISHNIGVMRYMADTIAVMYGGRMVEVGRRDEVLMRPAHPYTRALLSAVPTLGGGLPVGLKGHPPHFDRPREGCCFMERCPYSIEACRTYGHIPYEVSEDHSVMCLRKEIYV